MILIRLWRKIEITNPYENLGQIREIGEFPENTPTVRQKWDIKKPNFFIIRKFGFYVEVGSGVEPLYPVLQTGA
jgi:hypothetical protein